MLNVEPVLGPRHYSSRHAIIDYIIQGCLYCNLTN